MKLSEKIVLLRKKNGITQEELAAICNVSRQSISKWEADIALPEIEKLLILSRYFLVSIDVLLKDELIVDEVKEVSSCGNSKIEKSMEVLYEGLLVKEGIEDEMILDYMTVHKVELWRTGGIPNYWTALFFTSSEKDLPEMLSKVMIADPNLGGNWYVDFKGKNTKYIVFRNKILKYTIGNEEEKEYVCNECMKMGILKNQLDWSE